MAIRERPRGLQSLVGERGVLYREQLDIVHETLAELPGDGAPTIEAGDTECDHVWEIARLDPTEDLTFTVLKPLDPAKKDGWSLRSFSVVISRNSNRFHVLYDDHGPDDFRAAAELLPEELQSTLPALRRVSQGRLWFSLAIQGLLFAAFLGLAVITPDWFSLPAYLGALAFYLSYDIYLTRAGRRVTLDRQPAPRDRWWLPSRLWAENRATILITVVGAAVGLIGTWWFSRAGGSPN